MGVDRPIPMLLALPLEIQQQAAPESPLAILRRSRRLPWKAFLIDGARNKSFGEPLLRQVRTAESKHPFLFLPRTLRSLLTSTLSRR